jgi:acyl-coenzyme A synthetase/AMP-(fatty) acid ligase
MVEEKIKGSRINLSAIRKILLSQGEIAEAQVVAKKTRKGHELFVYIVPSANPKNALKKAAELLGYLEVRPKIMAKTLAQISGTKLKFEGIIVER